MEAKETAPANRGGAADDQGEAGSRTTDPTPNNNRARRSRRRRARNSNANAADSKRKGVASSGDVRTRKEPPQKNASQTSCASAPLPSTALSAGPRPRPRSLYTSHTHHAQPPPVEDTGFRARPPSWPREPRQQPMRSPPQHRGFAEPGKYGLVEGTLPPEEHQHHQQQQPQLWSGTGFSNFSNIPANLWRHNYLHHHNQQQQQQHTSVVGRASSAPSQGLLVGPSVLSHGQFYRDESSGLCGYADGWREHEELAGLAGATTTSHGTISLRLHNKIRLDMTVDRAVRLINFKNNIVLSLSGSGSASALLHPNGRIYQYGSRVEILAHDTHGNNKYAKMWYKGVSFTSEQCALVYLVDAAGARTTTDSFSDMSKDFSVDVFYAESRHGPAYIQEAATALSAAQYWITDEGVENWIINNVRISQTPDGLVRIARNSNKYQLRTSPSNGTASLTTPFLHCTASLGQTPHLFVRRGERRMHYDGTSFIVRNAGHSAGFDDNNQLKVY